MKFNMILIIAVLLLIFAIGAVSASEDVNTTDDIVSTDNVEELSVDDDDDEDDDDEDDENEYSIDFPDIVEDEYDTIDVELPLNTYGNLTVSVNNTLYKLIKDVEDGDTYIHFDNQGKYELSLNEADDDPFSIVLVNLNKGIYDINVTFTTTSKIYSHSSIVQVGNVQTDEEVSIDAEDSYVWGQQNKIYIDAPNKFIDNLDIKINGIPYSSEKIADQRVVDISGLAVDQYTIVVRYNNGKNFTSEEFEVIEGISYPEKLEYGSSGYVTLKLNNTANDNLIVKIDNTEIGNVKLVNGEAKILIPSLSIGNHSISARYIGSDFDIEDIEDEFEVFPKVTCPSVMNAGENKYLVIDVGNASGKVTVETDEAMYTSMDIKGKASINLAALDDEDYTLTVTFTGSDGTSWDEDYDISVKSVKPRIVGAKNINMIYLSSTNYKLTIYGTNSKLAEKDEDVEFKINGKVYDASTDKNGVVNFKIPNLAPGKYDITVIYDDKVSVKTKLVVKHLLKLKKAKIKKFGKKLIIKASLKKINGKYLRGKKITLKFKGKKYTAKTNKKGVAKFKINKKILKKLKVGKKVTYQAIYLKYSVKKSVKVKI